MKSSTTWTIGRPSALALAVGVVLVVALAAMPAWAQSKITLGGPAEVSSCGTITLTNVFENTGGTLNNLFITNLLPSAHFAFVPDSATLTLPDGAVLSGEDANPTVTDQELVWDFSNLAVPAEMDHLLITEVFYNYAGTETPVDHYQWFEIFNPTPDPVDVHGWSVKDTAPGQTDALPDFTIGPGEYVIVAGRIDAFMSMYPDYAGQVVEVADGKIGSGLNVTPGDGIILLDASNNPVDAVSYGNSTGAFAPAVPGVGAGQSIERNPADVDTNTRHDWKSATPNPGEGTVPLGLPKGATVTMVYTVEVDCAAVSGKLITQAGFEQPEGTPRSVEGGMFLTVNIPDLVVLKTPIMQDAGVGDEVSWTIRVENAGFGTAVNVKVWDTLGPGLAFKSFGVAPGSISGNVATWDAGQIDGLASLDPGDYVEIEVTAEVVACHGLFNQADASWGCVGLQVLENKICEDTSKENETATVGIRFLDRYPSLSYSIVPEVIEVDYCGGAEVTLYLTNAPGAGMATKMTGTAVLPAGWSIEADNAEDGVLDIGTMGPGESKEVTFRIEAGGCPVATNQQYVYFRPYYEDPCGNPFTGPMGIATAWVVNEPHASVTKEMPSSVSGDAGSFDVEVRLSYSNFKGDEVITVTDIFPEHENLVLNASSITEDGVVSGGSIVWANITDLTGSGRWSAEFSMDIVDACNGPHRTVFNRVEATQYVDCQGCTKSVMGSGERFPIRIERGLDCEVDCDFDSFKDVDETDIEVCDTVNITHTFHNFTGNLNDWTAVEFVADLAEGEGTTDTNDLVVLIDGDDVTSFVTVVSSLSRLELDLSGLNHSAYPTPADVGASLVIAYPVTVSSPGTHYDYSYLSIPDCDFEDATVSWSAGASRLAIELEPILMAGACGVGDGRIDLTMIPQVDDKLFPVHDVVVTLDLDFDGNNESGFHYVSGSTEFHDIVDANGQTIESVEPELGDSGYQWSWNLGEIGTDHASMYIAYKLRMECDNDEAARHRATVQYNDRCTKEQTPPARTSESRANGPPLFGTPTLMVNLQPEMQFLTDTQMVNQVRVLNACAVYASNLRVEMELPSNMAFGSAEIEPTSVTSNLVVWDFTNLTAPFGPLQNLDGEGYYNDLPEQQVFEFWVTNNVESCLEEAEVKVRASFGCFDAACTNTPWVSATYENISGSLVTKATFPATNNLCDINPVVYSVKNSGLTIDYDVSTCQTLPEGMTYVGGSSEVSVNGGTPETILDPTGSGAEGDPLTWNSAQIPIFAAMKPGDEVTIYYNVTLGCDAVLGDNRFIAEGMFTDICGLVKTNREVVSILAPKEPVLVVEKEASISVGDMGEEFTYTIRISHDAESEAPVPYLFLHDTIGEDLIYVSAVPAPDYEFTTPGVGTQLIWENDKLMAQTGDEVAPFELSDNPIEVVITVKVNSCKDTVANTANLQYGCSGEQMCLEASGSATIRTTPDLDLSGIEGELELSTCGGTKTVVVTNSGASTAKVFEYTEWAPAGYIFTGASAVGEFSGANLNVQYSGTPYGSVAEIDFKTDVSSGATDAKDDAGDGIENLDLGKNSGFVVTWTLVSTGDNLDCLADPTDLDFEDPDPDPPSLVTSTNHITFKDLCGNLDEASGQTTTYPEMPDLDIDLQPNSSIVTNGEVVNFSVTIVNNSETADADGIHARVLLGEGWTDVTFESSTIVSSGTDTMLMEQVGNTNLLFNFPGVVLNPLNDIIVVKFTATANANGGPLTALAEVVGDCGNNAITPSCTFTNTLGDPPLANTMQGSTLGPVNGQYYSFDQDSYTAAGLELTKTVRLKNEDAADAGVERDARVGEDLIYRIEAFYFGGEFENVTISDTLPTGLHFGTPAVMSFSDGITGASWDAGTGVFSLVPDNFNVPSRIVIDLPVVVSNRADVVDGMVITNIATTAFELAGVTNTPPEASTEVEVFEPNLKITKEASKTSDVQAGDEIRFTHTIEHTASSHTSAYSVVFSDTLPDGLVFQSWVTPASGTVAGQAVSVSSAQLASLAEFEVGDSPIQIVFDVLVKDQLVGSVITNWSQATYESLDFDSKNGNERDGSDPDGFNNYYTDDPETMDASPLQGISKKFYSSSQGNTADYATSNDWTIGERFIYEIRVDMPQGVVTNLVLTDTVPAGIDFTGTNPSTDLTYPGKGYEFVIPTDGPQFVLDDVVVMDPDPTPDDSTTTDGSGRAITFTFPAITNAADEDDTNDYFLLRMEFVALDMPINAGLTPSPRLGSNVVSVTDSTTTLGATGPVYRIVEHDMRVTKSRMPASGDAGDTITFTIVASNHVNALADAYKVVVRDELDGDVYDLNTFHSIQVPAGWNYSWSSNSSPGIYELTANEGIGLAPGARVTAQFSINLAQTVRPNQTYTNRVTIPTSSTISNDVPSGIKDRTDGATNTVTHTIPGMSIAKSLEATSESVSPPDSTGSFVQIGEVVTYRIGVTMPESTITNMSVVDTISNNGLAYIFGSARVDTNAWSVNAAFEGNTGNMTESPTGTAGEMAALGQAITFGFTNVVVTADNNTNNNTFYILADYLVRSNAVNNGLGANPTVHTNRATLTYQGNPGNTVTSAEVTTTVVEPKLEITKSLTPTEHVDAGDVISVTLVVNNTGTATAYDVVIEDVLELPYFDITTLANVVVPSGFVYETDGTTLRFKSDPNLTTVDNTIQAETGFTITFEVNTGAGLPPNTVATNTATVTGDSIHGPGPKEEQRETGDEDEDVYTSDDFHPTKTLIATSETGTSDSTGANLQIGEVATYEIAVNLPEGVITDLTITDVMPEGMAYVVGSATADVSSVTGTMGSPFVVSPDSGTLGASGQNVVMTWEGDSTIAATPGHSHTSNVLRVTLQAVMMDLEANSGLPTQTVLTNKATVTFANNPNDPAEVDGPPVTAVEPDLTIVKTVSPDSADAGDEITITLEISNTGTATAYDVVVSDVLDAAIFNLASVTNVSMPDGFTFATTPGTGLLTVTYASDPNGSQPDTTLEVGETLEFSFTVHVSQDVEPLSVYTNLATLTANTIDGDPPTPEERDYTTTDEDDFETPGLLLAKTLFSTSEQDVADSTGHDLQIGEVATYRLAITLPEGTIPNLKVVDTISDNGLAYIHGSARLDTTSFDGNTGDFTATPSGTAGDLAALGQEMTFGFTNVVVTADNDENNNTFYLLLDYVVRDVPANTGLGGNPTVHTNRASLTVDDNPESLVESEEVETTVIEPELAIVKAVSPEWADAGDVLTITLVLTNTGTATAYDLVVSDVLDAAIFNLSSVTNVAMPDGFTFDTTLGTDILTVTYASDLDSGQPTNALPVDEGLEFSFTVVVAQSVEPHTVYTNLATLTANTIDGEPPTPEERDYTTTDEDEFETPSMLIEKALLSTSEQGDADSTGSDVQIGETATYRLTVMLPEGTIQDLQVVDRVPAGMQFVPGSVSVDTVSWGFGGTLPAGSPTVTTTGGSGDDITIVFEGDTVVNGNNDPSDNWFTIDLTLLVLDVPGNTGTEAGSQTALPNSATISYDEYPPAHTSSVVVVEVVEPVLEIEKTMVLGDFGVVEITLLVTNSGLATAFDVEIQDVLDTTWWDTDTITEVSTPAGFTFSFAGNPGEATVTIASDATSQQPTNSIEVGEALEFKFSVTLIEDAPSPVTNLATVTEYSSKDGDDPNEREYPPVDDEKELPLPNYTLTKTLTSPLGRPVMVGETVTFDIVVENTGDVGLGKVPLDDTFDTTYLSFDSADPVEDSTGTGSIHWNDIGPIDVGASSVVTVTFTALESTFPNDTTNWVTTAPFTTNDVPLRPKTNEAPVEVRYAGYTLTKSRTSPTGRAAQVGEAVVFTISVVNTGEVDLVTVPVVDTYETAFLSYVSSVPASDDNNDDGVINWTNIGPIESGGSSNIVATFTAAASTTNLSHTNTVVASPTTTNTPPLPPKTNDAPYEVVSSSYTLTKERISPSNRPAIIGEEVVFQIVVANTGEAELVTVPVEDTYETAYLAYVSSVPASDDNVNDGTINWADIGPIPVGGSSNIVATFTAVTNTTSVHTNWVETAPTTPPEYPPVDPQTNNAPYEVDIPASIGDFVWLDVNGDGIQDGGSETGMPGVVVTLYDANTNVMGTATTDGNGFYSFTNLVPGVYFLEFDKPTGYEFTLQNQGGDPALDSDADPTTGRTVPTQLDPGENDMTWDVGLFELASLGDFIWEDMNADGIQDAGELGIENVTVTLYDADGTVVGATTTDPDGYYEFTDLPPGDYYVVVTPPAGWQISPQDQGSDDAKDSDIDPETGQTATITLVSGQNDPTWDGGLYLPASLGDFVWLDTNGDGIQDGTEVGIGGVVVTLYDENDVPIATTTTDGSGAYAFTNLVPGTYYVGFTPPTGHAFTLQDQGADDTVDSDADRTTGLTAPVTLESGEHNPTLDAGMYVPAKLGDRVWEDLNGDGVQDGGEPGIPGVKVTLYDADGGVVATTITDGSGNYLFDNLIPGEYTVHFERPSGYRPTAKGAGGDDAVDSDADPITGMTTTIVLESGDNDMTWDAGFYRPASVGDYVWLDENWDGVQDAGEAGIPNVVVELLDAGGNVIATTITDLNGLYLFTDLPPGDYTVRVDLSSLAPELAANPTYDWDGNLDSETPVTLQSGEHERRVDFGYNWNPDGEILGSIGDRIWVDTNGDGVQDPGEIGIPGVVVELYIDDGTGTYPTLVGTTTTDASGFYIFPELDANAYVVRVDPTTLPPGYIQTGDPDHFMADASTNPSQAGDHQTTTPIVLAPGDVFVNADFGYMPPAPLSNLGDLIYFDANADGVFDPLDGDYAIPGVTVVLLDEHGNVIASTITTGDNSVTNNYLFTDLPAGTYTVWVNDTDNVLDGLRQSGDPDGGMDSRSTVTLDGVNDDLLQDHGYTPDGHEPGKGLLGDRVWLDVNGDGVQDPDESGIQGVTVRLYDDAGNLLATTETDANGNYWFGGLDAGIYEVVVDTTTLPNGGAGLTNSGDPDGLYDSRSVYDLDQGEINLDQDFGYVADIPNAIGGTIWRDCNADGILDPEESERLEGVGVVLRDSHSNVVGRTFTDADGDYLFEGLPDGTYTVDVVDTANVLLGWWHSLGPDQAADDHSKTDPYTVSVAGGETNTLADFGYYLVIAEVGDYVWYDINGNGIQDGGEPGLANVLVSLMMEYPDGSSITMHTLTDATGYYLFGNLLLDSRYAGSTEDDPSTTADRIRFTIWVDNAQDVLTADGYDPTGTDMGDGTNDSREHSGVFADVARCDRVTIYDFGYMGGPLLSVIGNVDAFTRDGETVVRWETIESWDTAGYWLEREVNGEWARVSAEMIPYPLFGVAPIVFEQVDPGAIAGGTYRYRIVELEKSGALLTYGPYTLTVDGPGHTYADWAAEHFSEEELADESISGRDADPDGDGLTNWQEFLAGTDPRNADSVLRLVAVRRVAGGTELRWDSVPGRSYRIAVAASMLDEFLPLSGEIVADGDVTTYVVPSGERQLFFQVILVAEEAAVGDEP